MERERLKKKRKKKGVSLLLGVFTFVHFRYDGLRRRLEESRRELGSLWDHEAYANVFVEGLFKVCLGLTSVTLLRFFFNLIFI